MYKSFDYIIVGAGCSGLSLLVRLLDEPLLRNKQILLIDRQAKTVNDRTWCFWEADEGYFESIVHNRWEQLWLRHYLGDIQLEMGDYSYKMIRGIDFYLHCNQKIKRASNVQLLYGDVTRINADAGIVTVGDKEYQAPQIFSSVLLEPPKLAPGEIYLLQHFRGWWIETDSDTFTAATADMMNFRTSQQHGCAFVYYLPVSPRRALVEYTLFTEEELTSAEYDKGLKDFISEELRLENYSITEIENGVIPMTNMRFPQQQGCVSFIGTAGGQTKASTGYTFHFIQQQASQIAQALAVGNPLPIVEPPAKFRFYDSVLLRVLHERKVPGAKVFYRMFLKNKAFRVLNFLNNDTDFMQDLRIMNTASKSVFIPAAFKEVRKLWS